MLSLGKYWRSYPPSTNSTLPMNTFSMLPVAAEKMCTNNNLRTANTKLFYRYSDIEIPTTC